MREEEILIHLVLGVVFAFVFGGITAACAANRGRNAVGWFFIGFGSGFIGGLCLGWIPVLIVCVIPDLNEQRRREQYVDQENRRLREQLRQERLKGESFRQYTSARLDAHDEHLGVDTRTALPGNQQGPRPMLESQSDNLYELASAADQPSQNEPFHQQPRREQTATREWHYELEGATVGPINERMLIEMFKTGKLDGQTLVWTEQLDDWKEAREIKGLRPFLQ